MEKAAILIVVEIIEYVPNSVVIKSIIRKTTGSITAASFDTGESMTDKILAFDTFIQVIDGQADVIIDGKLNELNVGESIIIPANVINTIKAKVRFKMISTIIKSGYQAVDII